MVSASQHFRTCVRAEHSTYLTALSSRASLSPLSGHRGRCLFFASFSMVLLSSRRSTCVPTNRNGVRGQWWEISGTHWRKQDIKSGFLLLTSFPGLGNWSFFVHTEPLKPPPLQSIFLFIQNNTKASYHHLSVMGIGIWCPTIKRRCDDKAASESAVVPRQRFVNNGMTQQ